MTDVSQADDRDKTQGGSTASGGGETTADKFKSQFSTFKSQAGDKARDYAGKGVHQATDALDEAAKFLEDAARTVEEKLGPQYGRYGFSAAESVSGFASQLRGKELDELVEDARQLVRKSPAVAIGAAVGVGFILARLAKAGAGFESNSRSTALDTTGGTELKVEGKGGPGGKTNAANDGALVTPTFPA